MSKLVGKVTGKYVVSAIIEQKHYYTILTHLKSRLENTNLIVVEERDVFTDHLDEANKFALQYNKAWDKNMAEWIKEKVSE